MIRQMAVIKRTKNDIRTQVPRLSIMKSAIHKKTDARLSIKTAMYRPKKNILQVTCRYTEIDVPSITRYDIYPGDNLFDVPYTKWLAHVNQEVDLSTWEGTGIGMIGGPTKIEIAAILYDGILSSYSMFDITVEEIEEEIRRFQKRLEDMNYEYDPDVRKDIREYIRKGRQKIKELRQVNQRRK